MELKEVSISRMEFWTDSEAIQTYDEDHVRVFQSWAVGLEIV